MSPRSHIIQQQNIEIQFDDLSYGIGIQNETADLFYEKLFPKMEILFDELADDKHSIIIDRLEIDCGKLSANYWKDEFVEETLRHLRQQLIMANKKVRDDQNVNGNLLHEKIIPTFESLLFFLRKSYLPWNSRIRSIKEFEEIISQEIFPGEVIKENLYKEKLKKLFRSNWDAVNRFTNNFSESFSMKVLDWLSANKTAELERISSFLTMHETTPDQKRFILSLLLKTFSSDHPDPEKEFYSLLNDEQGKLTGKENLIKKNDAEHEHIYVLNAGLVILHPFLTELFTRIELLVDKKWKDVYSQHTAATVLEYLCTGKDEFSEFNLPLNKILCGIAVSEVLLLADELPGNIKSECEELLKEIIHHWSILKNTSVETLRETFLQRNGKLTKIENGWQINVEKKGVDILLNSLPWGIGTIKLPWTDEKFHVEWLT